MRTDEQWISAIRACPTFAAVACEMEVSRRMVEQKVRQLRDGGYGDRLPEYVQRGFKCECCGRRSQQRHSPSGFCWKCFVKTMTDNEF